VSASKVRLPEDFVLKRPRPSSLSPYCLPSMPLAPCFQGGLDFEVLMTLKPVPPYLAVLRQPLSGFFPSKAPRPSRVEHQSAFHTSDAIPSCRLLKNPTWLDPLAATPGYLPELSGCLFLLPKQPFRDNDPHRVCDPPIRLAHASHCSGYLFHLGRPPVVSNKPSTSASSCAALTIAETIAQLRCASV
jgi:hypothetical protein